MVKVLGPSMYRIADCGNPRNRKVVHFNRLKPANPENTREEEDYNDVMVHGMPDMPLGRLDHPTPDLVDEPAIVPRVPPPAAEAPAPAMVPRVPPPAVEEAPHCDALPE